MKKSKISAKENKFTFTLFISIILIILIPSLYSTESMDQQLEIRMLGLSVFLALMSAYFIINKKTIQTNSDLAILKNPFVIFYITYTFFIFISVFWATNKSEAIYEGLKRLSFLVLFIYLITIILPKDNYKNAIIKTFIIFGIIISVNGFLQFLQITSKEGFNIESIYKITGNYAQKNIFSEVLFLSFSFAVIGIFIFEKLWKSIAIISSILSILLIILLMTRAIWAGVIIAAIFTSIINFYFTKYKNKNNLKATNSRSIFVIIGIIIICISSVIILDKNNTISNQIKSATNLKEGNTYHRLNLWNKTIELSKKNPVLGVGSGNWRIEILQYDLLVYTEKGRIMPDRTHNDFLQLLAENGIVGLLLFTVCLILLIYYSIYIIRYNENHKDRMITLLCLFALIGYNIDSLFAFPRERIELQIFIHIIYAIIVYEYFKIRKLKQKNIKSDIKIISIIILFSFIFTTITAYASYKRMNAEKGVSDIYNYLKNGNHEKIIKTIDEIYSPFFTITPFGDPLMDIKATSMFILNQNKEEIFNTFEKSLKDSPFHLKTYQDIAVIHLNLKNYEKALEYCTKSFSFAPEDPKTKIIIAKIHLSQNNIDTALNVLNNIKIIYDLNIKKEFNQMILFILQNKVSGIASLTKNSEFLSNLNSIYNDEPLLLNIYQNSKLNKQNIEKIIVKKVISKCKKERIENDISIKAIIEKYS